MKSFFMLLFTVSALITGINEVQDTKTVTATYVGATEDGYEFTNADGETITFQEVDAQVAKAINLDDAALKGIAMEITYITSEEEDDAGEVNAVHTIVGLKPAQ